jgi:hypothetical protein
MSRNFSFKNESIKDAYEKVLLKEQEEIVEATLTKQHFIKFAEFFKKAKTLDGLKEQLLLYFMDMNPNFDEERFRKAADME